jgi:hypothetical protein
MSVEQLERSLARMKTETDEKYNALWTKYTKQMEQDAILIAHLRKQQPAEHRGTSEFTELAKDLREAIIQFESDSGSSEANARNWVHCAFESLFRIITERKTPSYQDIDNIQIIRKALEPVLDD